jgi:hypothetical protein
MKDMPIEAMKKRDATIDAAEDAVWLHIYPICNRLFLIRAKPFYNRIVFDASVTLTHVIHKASESFWKSA